MADSKYFDEVIEAICCDCPLGVTGHVDVTEEHCGGCPLFPIKKGTSIDSIPSLNLTENDTWLPCTKCQHATVTPSAKNSASFEIKLNDIVVCLNCPAKQLRDCINEGCAEALGS